MSAFLPAFCCTNQPSALRLQLSGPPWHSCRTAAGTAVLPAPPASHQSTVALLATPCVKQREIVMVGAPALSGRCMVLASPAKAVACNAPAYSNAHSNAGTMSKATGGACKYTDPFDGATLSADPPAYTCACAPSAALWPGRFWAAGSCPAGSLWALDKAACRVTKPDGTELAMGERRGTSQFPVCYFPKQAWTNNTGVVRGFGGSFNMSQLCYTTTELPGQGALHAGLDTPAIRERRLQPN